MVGPNGSLEIQAMLRDVIDSNRYMTLGTIEPDGLPRLSPVYYTHHNYRDFYWVSGAEAQHSKNLRRKPKIAIVIFDSSVEPGSSRAAYIDATARQVTDRNLKTACAIAFQALGAGARAFEPGELMSPKPLRLFCATGVNYAVHIRGSDPEYGRGVDTRLPITLLAD